MNRMIRVSAIGTGLLLTLVASGWTSPPDERGELLKVREAVWHA